MKCVLLSALLGISVVSSAFAGPAESAEYSRVKKAAASILHTGANEIRSNTNLAGKSEYAFVVYLAQAYQKLGYRPIDSRKVFSAVQDLCEGDSISGYITAGCLTDAILKSRGQ